MPNPDHTSNAATSVRLSRTSAQRLRSLFPASSYEDSISWLLERYAEGLGDHAACANTELWIKLDRLEETLSLLALTNVDVGDVYRRQVGAELLRMRETTGHLATLAKGALEGGGS